MSFVKNALRSFVLGVDGGASSSKAACIDDAGRVTARAKGESLNVVLRSNAEMLSIFKALNQSTHADKNPSLLGVALCLAGVIDEFHTQRVLKTARKIWKKVPIWIADDLVSALYGGLGHGEGVVAISGTGSSVYGSHNGKVARAGGWGHVLGDTGSAYYISHRALRKAVADYDATQSHDDLSRALLKKAQLKSIEELTTFVSLADKKTIAGLSEAVFQAAKKGHVGAQEIVKGAAEALARNTSIVIKRLGNARIPVCVAGGVFASQQEYFKEYQRALSALVPESQVKPPLQEGGIGAALWGWEQLGGPILTHEPVQTRHELIMKTGPETLAEIEKEITIESIPTEQANPRSKDLSHLSLDKALQLFIEEDKRYLFPALEDEISNLKKAIEMVSQSLKKGGRLFYVGAGTSGRLGVLDASECPPTFHTDPDQVQGIIAGGFEALVLSIEHAEDHPEDGAREVRAKGIKAGDVVCGISASGRTPFVLGAVAEARKSGADTIMIQCHGDKSTSTAKLVIALKTGPELLTGSTRLRAGTATKIALNMISTLSMISLGKIEGNYMVDLKPTNYKLMARAIEILRTLRGISKEEAFQRLSAADWQLSQALRLEVADA